MSWHIDLTVNTVKISKECAEDLCEADVKWGGHNWDSPEQVADEDGHVEFQPDNYEHMDIFADEEAPYAGILKKHKVKGDICFASLEGYNAGEFWGYRFDGKGGMKALSGPNYYESGEGPLGGMTFVITGTLSGMTRSEAHKKIWDLGGGVADSVSRKVTHMVAGAKPGSKVVKAKKLGIKILSEKQFRAMLHRR